MRHSIDPKIDCVFKALLGSEENRNLLVHFLNAILGADLAAPVVDVDILNPCNEKDFDGDKLSVVDVKARDSEGRQFQARNPAAGLSAFAVADELHLVRPAPVATRSGSRLGNNAG